ncbi:MAG: hypothetical protein K5790_01705 [Nitrosopumilus sp.]|uniref:hypothetical protein n=1 Tax=Nitrosopumilus sp. TaxID=2024843 RepID=UPI00247C5B34|nr:hypothetical protein [Nitrosopumilus sp.]MCV0391989.1 hypothetical protein [Nitrosopumilus sp.]
MKLLVVYISKHHYLKYESRNKTWALVSSIQKDKKSIDLKMITPQISSLVDEW